MSGGKIFNNSDSNRTDKIDWPVIQDKWFSKWEESRLFECDFIPSREKYFITVAYPYPNSPQHVGHGRTYTLADAHARYKRMRGYNVLFPMAFHYTGSPILGMSRRIEKGDIGLIDAFRNIYHVPEESIRGFVNPINIASYFHQEIKQGMKEMGYSIDWRREFTTIDPGYSKFISWQFRTMKKKGLIVQGSHPVGWCPNDQNPVSQHDTIGDVEPEFNEYLLIKFDLGGTFLPTATLRPETLYGVTNLWINPESKYVTAYVNNEKWIISRQAAIKLEFLNYRVKILEEVDAATLMGKLVLNPINDSQVPIYPAHFVDPDNGTGIVMSVPAHAPFDFQALEDLRNDSDILETYGIKVDARSIVIIESGMEEGIVPAQEMIRKYNIGDQKDPLLEKATSELYSHEYYKGRLMANTGIHAGLPVSHAKEEIKNKVLVSGWASIMYELVNKPVRCRCGSECTVKILTDQWFLNYSNDEWKIKVHSCIDNMDIVPDEIRGEFDYVIDWLKDRACARKSGLGTKLPWDNDWIIESLSDSVIYMAYYIIAKYFNSQKPESKINPESMDDSFFDYILLSQGNSAEVAEKCKVEILLLEEIKKDFEYFYPVDSRHSGRDLVPNHLSFFIFNHVAIFEGSKWPKQIVVNGSVLMDGKKMSKSLGNIIPLRKAIREYGSDPIRLAMIISAELLQDADFTFDAVKGLRSKLQEIYAGSSLYSFGRSTVRPDEIEDRWLLSRLQDSIADVTRAMDKLRVREALHIILYSLDNDLAWYRKRIKYKSRNSILSPVLDEFIQSRAKMLAPFAPFICEEIWENLGNSNFISLEKWPEFQVAKKDLIAEESEQIIMNLLQDLQKITKVTGLTPSKIIVYIPSEWKYHVYAEILKITNEGRIGFSEIMKQLIANPQTSKVKTDPGFVKKILEDILSEQMITRKRRIELGKFDERIPIIDASNLLANELGNPSATVIVFSEDLKERYDPKSKAKFARPFKPAVYLE